jgi:uncharacterized protein (DUF927 family)
MNDITHAFAPLRDEDFAAAQAIGRQTIAEEWSTISPIPDKASPLRVSLSGDQPSATWTYRDVEGRALGVECRWLINGEKEIRFATWCRHIDGREEWRLKHLPALRPIFGLDRLAAKPEAPVLVVEGPRKCEAAERIFPEYIAIAWPAGANSAHLVDWSPLKDRRVLIWPDNDDKGRQVAAKIADFARAAGAISASVVPVPLDFPPKWDLAEPAPMGADLSGLLAAAEQGPSCTLAATWGASDQPAFVSWGQFTMNASGLIFTTLKSKGDITKESEVPVSAAFEILGHARDPNGRAWGRWLRWRDADGKIHDRHVPDAALQRDPASLCATLADEGLHVVRGQQRTLCEYLNGCKVEERVTVVSRTGWHDVSGSRAFVLPDEVIGNYSTERVVLDGSSSSAPYKKGGTLEGWQQGIGEAVRDHRLPTLAVSAALAGPLLALVNQEGGGVNFYGASSRGKTTIAQAAASVWGRGSSPGFVRAWRATANGLEGAAASCTDTVLILDELGVVEARDAASAIYSLANGTGKARAGRDGSLRDPKTWRTLILSTGELPIEGKLAEDNGRRARAGQLVRMLDVPADRGLGFGVFDHGGPDNDAAKIADHIKKEVASNFGVAGPEFVRRLCDKASDLARHLCSILDEFVRTNVPPCSDGQVTRAAQRFGLIGAAGELACSFGICPWGGGAAFKAAAWGLQRWIEIRGGTGASEARQAIEQVRRFIEAHGEARFEAIDEEARPPVHNRAGWRSGKGAEQEWLVPPETWKSEICRGMDPVFVARVLAERKMLHRGRDSFQSVRKISASNRRVYVLTVNILASDGGHA